MSANTNPIIGAVIFARHGDRAGFYQSPSTYTASETAITPLGEVQEFQLGSLMRSYYANESSQNAIAGLNTQYLEPAQITSTVDGGGEGGVIYDSAVAFWQGFYPPSTVNSSTTLANGTIVSSPLGGYQYLQINAVMPSDDVDFEGYSNCPAWTTHTNAVYSSPAFVAKGTEFQSFLTGLADGGLVGGRNVSLANMYNIFDYMNVQSIHNATFAAALSASGTSTLEIVRSLANYHEYSIFTDSGSDGGIGNVAGRTFLSRVLPALNDFATDNSTTKLVHYEIAYKPFLSFFNLTDVSGSGLMPNTEAMVDYASLVTLEVRKNTAGTGHDVRFGFHNGSNAATPEYYPLFGSNSLDYDLDQFVSKLTPYVLSDNQAWCTACNNTAGSFCSLYAQAALGAANNGTSGASRVGISHDKVSPVGAGFIGFAVTLVVGLAILTLMSMAGLVSFGKQRHRRRDEHHALRNASISSL